MNRDKNKGIVSKLHRWYTLCSRDNRSGASLDAGVPEVTTDQGRIDRIFIILCAGFRHNVEKGVVSFGENMKILWAELKDRHSKIQKEDYMYSSRFSALHFHCLHLLPILAAKDLLCDIQVYCQNGYGWFIPC